MTLNRGPNVWVIIGALLLLNFLIVHVFFPAVPQLGEVPSTLSRDEVEAGSVVRVAARSDVLQGEFAEPVPMPRDETMPTGPFASGPLEVTGFSTTFPAF